MSTLIEMASIPGFVVTTVCGCADEFIERYHRRVEGRSIFVSVIEERAIGGECAFAILLADRRPILAGVCEVIEVFRDTQNEFGRTGMRLGIARLGLDSQAVWAELGALLRQAGLALTTVVHTQSPMGVIEARRA